MSTISDTIKGMDIPRTPNIDTGAVPIVDNKRMEELAKRLQETSPMPELMGRIRNLENGQKESSKIASHALWVARIATFIALASLFFAGLTYYNTFCNG